MIRIFSKDNLYSFILPRSWSSYEISDRGLEEGPTGMRSTLFINSTKYCMGMLKLPVFVFHIRENGVDFGGYFSDSERTICTQISSNDKYTVYMESVLPDGITGYYDDDTTDATEEDLQQLKDVIAMTKEIQDSFRWE